MKLLDYNATVTGKILLTPDLMILRTSTDEPRKEFFAGQYATIGLLGSEQRSPNSVVPLEQVPDEFMIKRPYSIASANHETLNFEFYISQIKSGQLTPRIFSLDLGSRLWISDRIVGVFNLSDTPKGQNIVMLATGTGLAPYISFLRSHIKAHQDIKIVVIHGAAYQWDLGYFSELQFIDSSFNNFFYYPTLIKPDGKWNGLKGYIEDHLKNHLLEEQTGIELNPDKTHVFVCGNPKMVESVSGLLSDYNYTKHSRKNPGSLHTEEW